MSDIIFVYVTCETSAQAENISRSLVEEKLAACVNILAPITSIYRWNDETQNSQEFPIIIKTRSDLFEKLEASVKKLHSYDNPCIVALPVSQGSEPFMSWIKENTIKP